MTINLDRGWGLREKILAGVNTLADCVSTTLGPKGQNVLIQRKGSPPFVTKDGVTVAKNIHLEDPFENAAAEVVKEVSARTNAEAGDGTTTSTVLASVILNQSSKYIQSGVSPIEIKRGLEGCLSFFMEEIEKHAKPLSSLEEIRHVATISANNDPALGDLVATAVDRVGKAGSITIEESRSLETSLELVEGFRVDSGWTAGAFVTDERRKVVRYDDPLFLITDSKIDTVEEILPALEIAARESKPLVIVADDVSGQALAALIMNSVRGSMKVCAIKAPRYGEERRQIMEDMAITTGAKFFRKDKGDNLRELNINDFGSARSVEASRNKTTIVDGDGDLESLDSRIEHLRETIHELDLQEAAPYQERLTRLSSGVAILRVGASTEVELKEKKHRLEDALEAVRAAQENGIAPGGGITLLKIAKSLSEANLELANEDQEVAIKIFKKALESPFRIIAINAGSSPDILLAAAEKLEGENQGYDFSGKIEVVDMIEAGIIDPVKVTKCAVKNSVSASATLLLTNHGIIEN